MMALVLILCFAGCGKNAQTTEVLKLAANSVKDVYPATVQSELHTTNTKELAYITKSGLVEIYIDKQTFSVAVKETLMGKLWYSLPVLSAEGDKNYDNSAAVVTLAVVRGGETFHLNSQDNSVAYGKASYKINSDGNIITGITVNYIITPDESTAKKANFSTGDIAFSVSVTYTMDSGSLYVTCSAKNLSDTDAKIENLGLLEFFGASNQAKAGDFMLVPDGCGALINTAVEQKDFKPLTFDVYGSDAGSANSTADKSALLGAYGLKQGDSGLAVLIEQGDAIAKISADRYTGKSGFNKVGANFDITSVSDKTKGKNIFRYISAQSYSGDIKLCYRFVSGSNATYSGIAADCREQLIRDRVLSTKTVEAADYLPFNLTVVGAVRKKLFGAGPFTTMAKLTTFEQAQDMLTRMKSKGINSIYLRYKGALSGGLDQSDISEAGFMGSLGGKSGFAALSDYMATQKMELYLDINLLSSREKAMFNESPKAVTINGNDAAVSSTNELSAYIGDKSFEQYLRPVDKTENVVLDTLTKFRYADFTGFCYDDAGRILYSDYSGSGSNRQDAALTMAQQLQSLSTGRKIMADGCNFYAIKNVDVLVDMPLNSTAATDPAYQEVPFIQLIMHGIVDYSGTPINEAKSPEDMMLRYIEYGACPSYEWCYTEFNSGADNTDNFYYDDWLKSAVDYYTRANEALFDLRDSQMVSHTQIADGIFCTGYEGNSLIYVNYTNKDYKVNEAGGFTVKAKDFLRIN